MPVERTPSGGMHLYCRCENPEGNLKLARQPDPEGKLMTVVETRGEGGFIVCAPTPGYFLIQGLIIQAPLLTADERDRVLAAARTLDRSPRLKIESRPVSNKARTS